MVPMGPCSFVGLLALTVVTSVIPPALKLVWSKLLLLAHFTTCSIGKVVKMGVHLSMTKKNTVKTDSFSSLFVPVPHLSCQALGRGPHLTLDFCRVDLSALRNLQK
jgi:hypothetical protein